MMETANPMGMYMPVAPAAYGYGGNDNSMFGGNWMWFLLVWMAMFGWGGNGFGFSGNNAYSDVQRGFMDGSSYNSYDRDSISRYPNREMGMSGHYPANPMMNPVMPGERRW